METKNFTFVEAVVIVDDLVVDLDGWVEFRNKVAMSKDLVRYMVPLRDNAVSTTLWDRTLCRSNLDGGVEDMSSGQWS